ncbi:uncharacterized protein Z518_02790 [Rhinocladiella mackenziei CBS 650.93]|uniref:Rhinocladiella mackenziei CBS 650.93 unplaced genomic scaffold supercont1.2, whole genome shotgun sequence n=1 Tax=Rhinocladiella mackenziei CBS 650.93 TaxID=1442369 RepID=A0A0D2IQD9_9EURO|nr:uncharacterized protein Z518_02790 [Rhinocladiella mackenziei CBS 650.93]KIX08134.1 hypothetical protein Z518_02790 [Rhinocladiella mackenziei CBS 650.93]
MRSCSFSSIADGHLSLSANGTSNLLAQQAANGDLQAYAMHKKAKERMVLIRGGIRKLNPDLHDELLKSKFFLPLSLYGKFVCEVTKDDHILVRFKENAPIKTSQAGRCQGLSSVIASKGPITTQAVEILQRIFKQIFKEPRFMRTGEACGADNNDDNLTPQPIIDQAPNEMSRVLHITDELDSKSL